MERHRKIMVSWLRRLLSVDQIVDAHKRRRTMLVGIATLTALFFTLSLLSIRFIAGFAQHQATNQESLLLLSLVALLIAANIYLLRRGLVNLASIILLNLILLCCLRGSLTWGIDLYTINILYPLLILLAAILLGRRFAFLFLLLIMFALTSIFVAHEMKWFMPNHGWRAGAPSIFNLLTLLAAYVLMSLFAWLTVRQLENSLHQEQQLNRQLQHAKTHLEAQVRARTRSLEKLQLEQLLGVSNFVELGKLTAGLLHDLKQPLSVLHIAAANHPDQSLRESLMEIDDLLLLQQRQSAVSPHYEMFSVLTEVQRVVSLCKYKLQAVRARVVIQSNNDLDLYADRAVFHKVLANLLINAIESLSETAANRHILLSWRRNRLGLRLSVKDFGRGMTQAESAKLFTPRFSTKNSLGLGLYLANETMQQAYGTTISFRSEIAKGSTFTIYIKNRFIRV